MVLTTLQQQVRPVNCIDAATVSTDDDVQASNRASISSHKAVQYIIATMKTINAAMFIIRMAEQCIIVAGKLIMVALICIMAAMFISREAEQSINVARVVIMAVLICIIAAMISIIAAMFHSRTADQSIIAAMKQIIAAMIDNSMAGQGFIAGNKGGCVLRRSGRDAKTVAHGRQHRAVTIALTEAPEPVHFQSPCERIATAMRAHSMPAKTWVRSGRNMTEISSGDC